MPLNLFGTLRNVYRVHLKYKYPQFLQLPECTLRGH